MTGMIKMAVWVKALATKTDDLRLIHGIHMVEGRSQFPQATNKGKKGK